MFRLVEGCLAPHNWTEIVPGVTAKTHQKPHNLAWSIFSGFPMELGHLYFMHHLFLPWRDFSKERSGIVIKLLGTLTHVGFSFRTPYLNHWGFTPSLSLKTNQLINLSIKRTFTFLWRPIHSPYAESCFYLVTLLEQHSMQGTCSGPFFVIHTNTYWQEAKQRRDTFVGFVRIASWWFSQALLKDSSHTPNIPQKCSHQN